MLAWILNALVPFLIDLAVKYGLPAVATWILTKFPKVPADLVATIIKIINDAILAIEGHHPSSEVAKVVLETAKRQARDCIGIACSADLKKD